MKVSLNWLREWVDLNSDAAQLAHELTMAGLEIEGVERAGPPLPNVVVAEVRSVEKHPDAERLKVCRVWDGAQEWQVVCGAANVRAGMKAPLARLGATLPDGQVIKEAKLRGIESSGMLCSARELKLNEDASGLMDLPAELTTGTELAAALALDDMLFEINLTPNRGDCMSIAGVAREVSAARAAPLHSPEIKPVQASIDDTFPVAVNSPGCPKYVGRVIQGMRSDAASPAWMQERLRRAGVRPISAAVDVTNYVMLELGQPMHAYDLRQLQGRIVVRQARDAEQLKLLDGRTIELTPDVLVIADEQSLLGMGGVMGGEDSGINTATTDVLLEAAFFDPAQIAGRGRRYGLVTDASQRFERGVDPQLQERAMERATQLLLQCAGGKAGPLTVARSTTAPAAAPEIRLRQARVQQVLGVAIDAAVIHDLLVRLGVQVTGGAGEWRVTPPSWRFDLRIEADLVEEIARLYGFDRIPEQQAVGTQQFAPLTETLVRNERAMDLLVDRGYYEAITYSFTAAPEQSILFPDSALALSNPISAELGVMRLSLWPGLLQAVRENSRRQRNRVRLFEIGRRFDATGGETEVIAAAASGPRFDTQWGVEASKIDFFDVKADLEALIALSGAAEEFRFVAKPHSALHPGQAAQVWRGTEPVGWVGAIHPEALRRLDLTYPVYVFELETAKGLRAGVPQFQEISKFPGIGRDITAIVDETCQVEALLGAAREGAGRWLRDLTILSVYRGPQIEKGKKSIALGLHLQDTSRTLTDREADSVRAQVVDRLVHQLGATIRDK